MKFTNRYNLPDVVVRALTYDPYDAVGDVSVTSLLQPARKIALTRRHSSEIEEDVTDRIWMFFGRMGHVVLENAAMRTDPFEALFDSIRQLQRHELAGVPERVLEGILIAFQALPLIEERVCAIITGASIQAISFDEAKRLTNQPHEGIIVTGKADHVDPVSRTITDWKNSKVWAHIHGSRLEEWKQQLNLYALLYGLHHPDIRFDHLSVVEFLHDWDKNDVLHHGYPDRPIFAFDLERQPDEDIFHFAEERATTILSAIAGTLPQCTDEERWYRKPEYAVYSKPGAARARRVFKSDLPGFPMKDQADEYAKSIGGVTVQRRPSNPRCDGYCTAAPFCEQYIALQRKYDTLYGPLDKAAPEEV